MQKAKELEDSDYDRAMEIYAELLEYNRTNSEAWNRMGVLLQMRGTIDAKYYKEALDCLDSAIKYKKAPVYYFDKGIVYHNMGDLESAVYWLKISDSLGYKGAKEQIKKME
jgi:tetratricopeptide (TPR) repeat protein